MATDWERLLNRTDLTDEELGSIPVAPSEMWLAIADYMVREGEISEPDMYRGVDSERLHQPGTWLTPQEVSALQHNVYAYSRPFLTHHECSYHGRYSLRSTNAMLLMLLRLLPMHTLLKGVSRQARKLTNFGRMSLLELTRNRCLLRWDFFPYAHERAIGADCYFTVGVLCAMLDAQQARTPSVRHILCSCRVSQILNHVYFRYNWEYSERNGQVRINGRPIGERVCLARANIGGQDVFVPRVDRNGTEPNAVRITHDFVYEGKAAFREGEFYDAPYCVFEMTWKDRPIFGRLMRLLTRQRLLSARQLEGIDRQFVLGSERLLQAEQAARESERKSSILRKYTRQSLVRVVDTGGDPTSFDAQERDLAVMFCDIRSFTTFSEKMSPVEVVKFLNSYFARMNGVIMQNKGEIDKLIGDCIMAVFESPDDGVRAAVSMREQLSEYVRERLARNASKVGIGMGLTYGPVVVGNIGSQDKMDYTLIGDVVNASSRLESLTKHYGVGILISDDVRRQLSDNHDIRFVDRVLVKGKQTPMDIYEVYDHEPERIRAMKRQLDQDYVHAFSLYTDGRMAEALRAYDSLIERAGKHSYLPDISADPLLHFYRKRCATIAKSFEAGIASPEQWQGIYEFTEK